MSEELENDKFKVGDLVTRDGTDIQKVVGKNADDQIEVECIVPPTGGWCQVGEREWNLARRYVHVRDIPIEGKIVPKNALPKPDTE